MAPVGGGSTDITHGEDLSAVARGSSTFAVNFTATYPAPGVVTFTASGGGGTPPYQYSWSFGDGTTSSGATVTHQYSSTGTYEVELTGRDAAGNLAYAAQAITPTSSSGTAVNILLLVLGAAVAALVGVGLGVWASRRIARAERQSEASLAPPPVSRTASNDPRRFAPAEGAWGGVRAGPYLSPPYSAGRAWPGAGTYAGTRLPAPATTPRPVAGYPPYVAVPLTSGRPPQPPAARPPTVPTHPPVPSPSVTPGTPSHVSTLVPLKRTPRAEAPPTPPDLQRFSFALNPPDGIPLVETVRQLNATPWAEVEVEGAKASSNALAGVLARIDPTVRTIRRTLHDSDRARMLLHDIVRRWYDRGRPGPGEASAPTAAEFQGVFASSPTEPGPSLLERLGEASRALTLRALWRMAPVLVFLIVLFAVVESATLALVFLTFHGAVATSFSSLVIPAAVLGPPALILCLYPVGEWGHLMLRRFRYDRASAASVSTVISVRMACYLLVLGLAEVSRVIADVVAGAVFHAPSTFVVNGAVDLLSVAAFLFLLSVTLAFAWSTVSGWNLGGSPRAMWGAALLYLAIFAIWAGTEGRIFLQLAQGATWTGVAQVQTLLTYVPVYLVVAIFFVVMVFLAFSEPDLQRAHSPTTRFRDQVAQAFIDDLEAGAPGSSEIELDRLSELARGGSAPRVASALRDLFSYDPETDRYVVLRSHEEKEDRLLALRLRQDSAGSYYVLELRSTPHEATPMAGEETRATSTAGAGAPSGDLWSRTDLVSKDAWTSVLRSQAGKGRLARPPSEAREEATYRSLLELLSDPGASEARELFRKFGWARPSGVMMIVMLLQAGQQGNDFVPEVETDGEYLEVELDRLTGKPSDPPYLGPWDPSGWHIERKVSPGAKGGGISYRATLAPGSPSPGPST